MATKLGRPVSREVRSHELKAPPLIVTLNAVGLELRVKGTRTRFLLPYELAYLRAAQLVADQRIRTKRSRRTTRGLLTTGTTTRSP